MKPIVKGMFARSLAGHDKGKLYVISDVQPDYEMTDAVRDEDIRKALKEKSCKELKED